MSIDQEKFQLQARLAVIETMFQRLMAVQLKYQPDPMAAYEKMLEEWGAGLSQQTFAGVDPAMADLIAQELQTQSLRILEGVKEFLEKRR